MRRVFVLSFVSESTRSLMWRIWSIALSISTNRSSRSDSLLRSISSQMTPWEFNLTSFFAPMCVGMLCEWCCYGKCGRFPLRGRAIAFTFCSNRDSAMLNLESLLMIKDNGSSCMNLCLVFPSWCAVWPSSMCFAFDVVVDCCLTSRG